MKFTFDENQSHEEILKVSEITSRIKSTLENRFMNIAISGEISNCRPASSGHLYFTLKDNNASISAVMFKGKQNSLAFSPQDGQMVIVRGNISLYAPRGSYQIIANSISLAGEGELLALLEKRKQQLASEGLFDQTRKKSLPKFPSTVAVITSPTGAALRDIINVINRRNGGIKLQIFGATVQGSVAAKTIANRIRQINRFGDADVIIIARGGGSIEDLLPFSEEEVVRAVSNSKIPLISAIGHEIDWALSDFAADLRAPTPSAAAELVTSDSQNILASIKSIKDNLFHIVQDKIETNRSLLRVYSGDEMRRIIESSVDNFRIKLDNYKDKLYNQINQSREKNSHRLLILKQRLEENSPKSLGDKGLARIITNNGKNSGSIKNIKTGDDIKIEFFDGTANAKIMEIKNG